MERHLKGQELPGRGTLKRGRPSSDENRHVVEDIRRAAQTLLETTSPHRITVSEIAARASTRPAMVYYYFGDMEELLTDILEHNLREILEKTQALQLAIQRNEVDNPLRAMIVMFSQSYNQRPALMRLLISELLREDSRMRRAFVVKWPAFGKKMMEDVIGDLVRAGRYRADTDVEGVCAMLRSVIFFPLIIKPYLAREGETIEHYLDEKWVDFVSHVFECYLRSEVRETNVLAN